MSVLGAWSVVSLGTDAGLKAESLTPSSNGVLSLSNTSGLTVSTQASEATSS